MAQEAVHFRGIEGVLEAYQRNEVIPWAIISQKEIMFSCTPEFYDDQDGAAGALQGVLQMLAPGSGCKYTLQVYKIKGDELILSNTPYFRAFKFSLDQYADMSPYSLGRNTFATQMGDRLSNLENRLEFMAAKLEAPESEKPEVSKIGAMLNGIIDNPMVRDAIAMKVAGFFGLSAPPGKVAGMQPPPVGESLLTPDQVAKVQQALDTLCRIDAKLGDHLLALAKIAKETPSKYSMYASML
jgi:hypothetical protein